LSDRLTDLKHNLESIVKEFENELSGIRGNRATPGMVDSLEVEAYGSKMKLRDLAHISVPEARLLVVQPFDASLVDSISKSLASSGLGITPSVDGSTIRLPLPPLTEESRSALKKLIAQKQEIARVAVRMVRMDYMGKLDKEKKDSILSEDEHKRQESLIQKEVDANNSGIDRLAELKEQEVMAI